MIHINFTIKEGWEYGIESAKIIIKENTYSQHTLLILGIGILLFIIGAILAINWKIHNKDVEPANVFDSNERRRNKEYQDYKMSIYFKDDFKTLKNYCLNYHLKVSDLGILLMSDSDIWDVNTIQGKYIKWNEVKEITKRVYPGWGYLYILPIIKPIHMPLIVGSWCVILKNGERHSLGWINKKNVDILLEYFKRYKEKAG